MMWLQKLIGIVLAIIGIAGHSPLLIFVGIFLILTKYDYTSPIYGDPRGRNKDAGAQ